MNDDVPDLRPRYARVWIPILERIALVLFIVLLVVGLGAVIVFGTEVNRAWIKWQVSR